MKRNVAFFLCFLALAACNQKPDNTVSDSMKVKAYEMEQENPITIVGNFISSDKTDTLQFRHYSNKTHRYVDSLPIGGDDYMLGDDIDWFRENDIVMKVTTADGRLVHTETDAMYMLRAIPLPNLLPETDAIAVVWKCRDFSAIRQCYVVSVKEGQWTELGSFTVNYNAFPDTLTEGMIDGFLEERDGVWMFSDWTEQLQSEGECPMRPLRNILDTKEKVYNFFENRDYICYWGYDQDVAFEYSINDSAKVDSIAKLVRGVNLRMTPYNSLSEIKKEFDKIFNNWNSTYDFYQRDMWENILRSRMRFHFSNPITYRYWKPTSRCNPLEVAVSPDGKFKFYTTWDICSGTMGLWITFYQYIDSNGKLVCKEWQEDRRFDCKSNPTKVWQFTYHDSTFYVLKSFRRAYSVAWGYSMEIVTFDNGEPTYHIHFFPDMKDYREIKKLWFKNGQWEESDWVKEDGSYFVCFTDHCLSVNYDFNPKTLTVIATTQADTGDAVITKKWKLKTY